MTLAGPQWAGVGLPEGGQAQSVDVGSARARADLQCVENGLASPQYFEAWACLKARRQQAVSGLTLTGTQWAGFGLSEGGQAQSVDVGPARTRADLQCVEDGLSMPLSILRFRLA